MGGEDRHLQPRRYDTDDPVDLRGGRRGDRLHHVGELHCGAQPAPRPTGLVLIDKVDQPYAGVHYTGQAETGPKNLTPQQYAQLFGRYIGDLDLAAQSYEILNSLGLGQRFYIRFRPVTKVTWDFGKIPGAGTDADPLRPQR